MLFDIPSIHHYTYDGNGVKSPASAIYLNDSVDVWYFPGSQWKWIRVPISRLNLTNPVINSILIETGSASEIHYHSVFWSSQYQYLTALVKVFDSGQNVYPYFLDADTGAAVLPAVRMADYLPGGVHNTGVWRKVTIPMSALLTGRGGAPVRIGSVMFESAMTGTVLLDNIVFTSPIVLKWPLQTPTYANRVVTQAFGVDWAGGSQCPPGVK